MIVNYDRAIIECKDQEKIPRAHSNSRKMTGPPEPKSFYIFYKYNDEVLRKKVMVLRLQRGSNQENTAKIGTWISDGKKNNNNKRLNSLERAKLE